MTVQSPASWISASSHSAQNDRNLLAAIILGAGITDSNDLKVSQHAGTPNMSVDVAAGSCFLKGTETTYQGIYHGWNDAVVTLTIAAADATNPRRDLVVAKVRDAAYSGSSNDFSIVVVTGTPAASPADPATPNNAIVLARVAVAANATSVVTANITDLRARVARVGVPTDASVATSETTASGSYTDLATVGPSVSIVTGAQAKVTVSARISNTTAGSFSFMGFAINGTVPADDTQAIGHALGSNGIAGGATFLAKGLTPGTNVFKAVYRVTGNTGTFLSRRIMAEPA